MRFDMLRCRVKPRYPGAAECSPEKWGCTSCIQESLLRSATHITASHPEFVALAKTTTSIFLSCATGAERRQRLRRRATSAREMQSAEISWAVVAIVTLCMKHVTVKLTVLGLFMFISVEYLGIARWMVFETDALSSERSWKSREILKRSCRANCALLRPLYKRHGGGPNIKTMVKQTQ